MFVKQFHSGVTVLKFLIFLGFHYGIYCCESCKGFFKRTVQNNKSFSCRLSADCTVELSNRKKCPACRFEKCKQVGMKVEGRVTFEIYFISLSETSSLSAIRPDRTRGGRSNYEGKNTTTYHSFTSNVQKKRQNLSVKVSSRPSPSNHQVKARTLSSFLTNRVPSILQDLLAIESVMYDLESEEQNCSDAICSVLGCSMELTFDSLLHLADHCLYRIVRWARSNPDFVYIPASGTFIKNIYIEQIRKSIKCTGVNYKMIIQTSFWLPREMTIWIRGNVGT